MVLGKLISAGQVPDIFRASVSFGMVTLTDSVQAGDTPWAGSSVRALLDPLPHSESTSQHWIHLHCSSAVPAELPHWVVLGVHVSGGAYHQNLGKAAWKHTMGILSHLSRSWTLMSSSLQWSFDTGVLVIEEWAFIVGCFLLIYSLWTVWLLILELLWKTSYIISE